MSSVHLLRQVLAVPAMVATLAVGPAVPSAEAQPPGFPDLNAFTEAPANLDFSRPDRWANGYAFFRTPDGLSCMIGGVRRCSGPLPGLPVEYGECAVVLQTHEEYSRSAPFRFEKSVKGCPPPADTLLNIGQKLTLTANNTTTCVVGEDRLTACIDGDGKHGFVLQPSGSWAF